MSLQITDETINEVLETEQLVMIDFWAEWCGPCRMLGPIIDELSVENADVTIGKLDASENAKASSDYNITSIPCIVFIKDGKEVGRVRGVQSKAALQAKINEFKN